MARKISEVHFDANHVEALAVQQSGPRLYVNVTDKNDLAVIDKPSHKVVARWPIKEAEQEPGTPAGHLAAAFEESGPLGPVGDGDELPPRDDLVLEPVDDQQVGLDVDRTGGCGVQREELGALRRRSEGEVAPFLFAGNSTGTICDLKRHSLMAATALRCEFTANSSCSSRVMPYFSATFSPVIPMW